MKNKIVIFTLLWVSFTCFGQVGIGTTDPNESSVLILTHKLIWLLDNQDLLEYKDNLANSKVGGTRRHEVVTNNFYSDIYTDLVALKQQGKQVLVISGDI